jgi:hypothetical protein
MNELEGREGHHSEDWAPHDYTDGRKPAHWKTRYPDEARKWIRIEAGYLVLLSLASLAGVLYMLYLVCDGGSPCPATTEATVPSAYPPNYLPFTTCVGALVAGLLGGCCFGIKWLYHGVAKQLWNEDRRLWRFFMPPLSGVVALFTMLLLASDLLQIFDKDFIRRPIAVIAFSFLIGYFSDRALAKMAELADTLLGRTDKGQ